MGKSDDETLEQAQARANIGIVFLNKTYSKMAMPTNG